MCLLGHGYIIGNSSLLDEIADADVSGLCPTAHHFERWVVLRPEELKDRVIVAAHPLRKLALAQLLSFEDLAEDEFWHPLNARWGLLHLKAS